jgi:VWFA-related protein
MGRLPLVVCVLGVAWAAGAAIQPPTQAVQRPAFRAGVDHVELDVVVTDGHDKTVKDLTKDDFEIIEHGRPQTIADFEFLSVPRSHRAVPDVKTAVPTVDVVTNTHPPLGRQWALVIDDLHIIEQHIPHTKKVIQAFLEAVSPDDQVAIVFVGRSDLSQDFTSDLSAQMRTVNRIRDALGFAYDAADTPPTGGDNPMGADVSKKERHRYAGATLDVLKNVCAALVRSTYPRKALVYVSEGMTYKWDQLIVDYLERDVFDQLLPTFESARRAGVPVYPIDPRGIPDCSSVRGECPQPPWPNINAQFNNMRTLAENTGGLAFVNRPNMTEAVQDLIDDNSSVYLLGYYPEPFERDGKFHDVKVAVKRPGLRVRARAGYAAPKAATAIAAEAKRTLDDALGAALPVGGLSLRAFAAPVVATPHGMKTLITLEVTYPGPLEGAKIDDTLQFGILALDREGHVKGSTRRAFHFVASPKGAEPVTYAINDWVDLPSQSLTLRVGVASESLGTVGTIHLPVEVIDASRSQLQMSGVVIGFAGPARQAAVPPGALKDLVPFQPTTSRTFAATDTLQLFAPLSWASADTSVAVNISIRRDDEIVMRRSVQVPGLAIRGAHRQAVCTVSLPLTEIAAGSYVLELVARLANGQAATRDVAFDLR